MIRILAIGIAVVLAAALVPQGSLTAAAAEAKARKPQAAKGTDISPWTVTHGAVDPKAKRRIRGGLDDEGRMENLRLQQNMDRYQKSTTMQSGVAKKQDATKKGMVKKMK